MKNNSIRTRLGIENFKNVRFLTLTGLFIALYIVLDQFSLQVTESLRIGFSFLMLAMVGLFCGPVLGMAAGAICDIMGAVLFPRGAYFPGYTVSAIVGGLIYGLLLYRKPVSLWRSLLSRGLVDLFVNVGLNTLWLSITMGQAWKVLVVTRFTKNAILLVPEALVLFGVSIAADRIARRIGWTGRSGVKK